MPSHNYHIKFELYPTSDPAASAPTATSDPSSIWAPGARASIFDDLPSHPRRTRQQRQQPQDKGKYPSTAAAAAAAAAAPPPHAVIDCARSSSPDSLAENNSNSNAARLWRARSQSIPAPGFEAGIGPRTAGRDWRFGDVRVESFDPARGRGVAEAAVDRMMGGGSGGGGGAREEVGPAPSLGPTFGGPGQATKGRYVPLETRNTEVGWGIVHLYRESEEEVAEEEEGRGGGSRSSGGVGAGGGVGGGGGGDGGPGGSAGGDGDGDDGTILCIPAVPSYLSPSDFLGFVGEKWRGDVCHYRMVMTSRMNRYMVLMKFRDRWKAGEWRREFDGRAFNSMEPEICHVTYIKSITFETPKQAKMQAQGSSSAVVSSLKPFPPPTPDLIELPTCPVCLERMDDTTGLMTILCQHVFHCTCLQTWKGSGCPVCRATNPSLLASTTTTTSTSTSQGANQNPHDPENPYTRPFGQGVSNLCSVCDCPDDLWICLICGNVGCGRYKGGHAKEHWKDTAHSFSLELTTQHVWDYAGDMWVHRLIRDKGDGKVVELPSRGREAVAQNSAGEQQQQQQSRQQQQQEDVVPRAKLDNIGLEYTNLLNSQLETQRVYFEEKLSKLADRAAKSAAVAEAAAAEAREATRQSAAMRQELRQLREEAVPSLERDLARERARAAKSTELARTLGRSLQEEKEVGRGLMERVAHVNREAEGLRARAEGLAAEKAELEESNRDLTMFISGQEQLRRLEGEGKVEAGELEEGTVSLPEEKKGKGKGKGRKK